ncbi:hypothetical protein EC988_002421 [Linderina pennispora]|nr:hypothetical protein EC988_002421 [Linderina pennispora]
MTLGRIGHRLWRYRWLSRTALAVSGAAGVYAYDKHFQASALARTARTFKDIAAICIDYKLNFRTERGVEHLNMIHERGAKRLLRCCQENGGMFIKFGQSIALQGPLLPPAYGRELSVLYDNAPFVPVAEIAPVIERNFPGSTLDDLFVDFSQEAVASASVAQVHTARLRRDPTQLVAVKVQKPEIKHQIAWDLFAFRTCALVIEKAFGIPMMWSVSEVEQRLREETDFEREGHNADRAQDDLNKLADRWLQSSVYIPKVHWEETRREVLTTEWIDGTSMVEPKRLTSQGWSEKDIMNLVVSVFAFQIFVSGNVHGDPHPGNILVRQHPQYKSRPQLVLLDHGLYIRESRQFRKQYAEFWRAAMIGDNASMRNIVRHWGFGDTDMFSTMISLRPPTLTGHPHLHKLRQQAEQNGGDGSHSTKDAYKEQMEFKRRAIAALKGTRKLPQELVFVSRNMNIVRASNRSMGIPVNRIKILGHYAAYGLHQMLVDDALSPNRRFDRVRGVVSSREMLLSRFLGLIVAEWSYLTFNIAIAVASTGMALYEGASWIWSLITGNSRQLDSESLLDENVQKMIERKLGYKIDTSLFSA